MLIKRNLTTTEEQSKRLINLGLKRETADCAHLHFYDDKITYNENEEWVTTYFADWNVMKGDEYSPVWSVLRLEQLLPPFITTSWGKTYLLIQTKEDISYYDFADHSHMFICKHTDKIDRLIACIESLIKMHQFDKKYLKED